MSLDKAKGDEWRLSGSLIEFKVFHVNLICLDSMNSFIINCHKYVKNNKKAWFKIIRGCFTIDTQNSLLYGLSV